MYDIVWTANSRCMYGTKGEMGFICTPGVRN